MTGFKLNLPGFDNNPYTYTMFAIVTAQILNPLQKILPMKPIAIKSGRFFYFPNANSNSNWSFKPIDTIKDS